MQNSNQKKKKTIAICDESETKYQRDIAVHYELLQTETINYNLWLIEARWRMQSIIYIFFFS